MHQGIPFARGAGLIATSDKTLPHSGIEDDSGSLDWKLYRSILKELPIALLVLDIDGLIFEANSELASLSGYGRKELIGSCLDSLIPKVSIEKHKGLCADFRFEPSQHLMGSGTDLRMRSKKGTLIPVSVGLNVFVEGGRRFILACVSDLTELRASQAEKEEIERRLKDMNRDLESQIEGHSKSLTEAHIRLMEQRQLQKDMEVAGQIQASLLPKVLPRIEGYELASRAKPSRLVSGDIYDFRVSEKGYCSIMLADISGKGMPAAIFASSARSLYLREAKNNDEPSFLIRELNSEMLADLGAADRFITMVAARLCLESGALEIANAGGCETIIFDSSDLSSRVLSGGGLPLGLFPDTAVDVETIGLRPGMGALIYSDGLTEAENPRGELFGLERLLRLIAECARSNPETMADSVLARVEEFAEDGQLADDATFVVLKASPRRLCLNFTSSLKALDEVPARVATACFAYGEALANDIHLALSEILANIREHGYESGEGPVVVDIRLETRGVEITVKEWCEGFDPSTVLSPPLGEAKERGFGLYLVRETMDDFSYESGGSDGNLWILFRSTK